MTVGNAGGVCPDTAAGRGGAEMPVDRMTRSREGGPKYIMMENKGSNEQRISISKLHGIKKKEVRECENFAGNADYNHVHSLNRTAFHRRLSGLSGRAVDRIVGDGRG